MPDNLVIRSPKDVAYELVKELPEGEVYRIYLAIRRQEDADDKSVIVKVATGVDVNDLALNEARVLTHINQSIRHMSVGNQLLVPELLESFTEQDRQVVITDFANGYVTVEQIRKRFPHGLPPEHVAWMFNRMLNAMMLSHSCGVIHGAILPPHALILSEPKTKRGHLGTLIDWTNAVIETSSGHWPKLSSMSGVEKYECFYPREVLMREPATPQTDLAMAAGCAIYLLGGDVRTNEVPGSTPWNFAQLLTHCRKDNPAERPRNIVDFYEQLQRAHRISFGPPTFRELDLS